MKILQIIPDFGMGGAETMCEGLCRELTRRGHSVVAVSLYSHHTPITDRMEADGLKVRYLGKRRGLAPGCIGRLRQLILEEEPDVLHTHLHALKYAALANLGLGLPLLHTVHNQADREAARLDRFLSRFLFTRGFATPVSLSREIQKSVMTLYGLKEEATPVVHNGIDLSRCRVKSHDAVHYPVRLIHVGRFYEQKNHACILEALALLQKRGQNVTVSCYGDGPLMGKIRQQAAAMGLENRMLFQGVTGDIFPQLEKSDIFILPSKWEGIPMTVIEAMGSGLPVIASRVGGLEDMITDGVSGLLIAPQPEALAEAVCRLIGDEALRERLGENAQQAAKAFSMETMADGYLNLYQKKVGAHHANS